MLEGAKWLRWGDPSSDPDFTGIAVAIGDGTRGLASHCGIVHRDARKGIRFLHLAWHNELKDEPLPEGYAWAVCPLPREHAKLVAARCRAVLRANANRIPYGPRFDKTGFSSVGRLLLGDSENGLTCSTFVLAVFENANLPLVVLESWPHRASDAEFKAFVVTSLKNSVRHFKDRASVLERIPGQEQRAKEYVKRAQQLELHIDNVVKEPACVRYRPDEVCGASSSTAMPVRFEEARARADEINRAFGIEPIPEPVTDASGAPTPAAPIVPTDGKGGAA